MSYTFSILINNQAVGILPSSDVLNGSTDLGDLVNSWVTYTSRILPNRNSIVNSSILTMVATLVDSFRLDVLEDEDAGDEVIVFRGRRYYLDSFDYTEDERGGKVLPGIELVAFDADQIDFARSQTGDLAIENIELLEDFVQGFLANALNQAGLRKVVQYTNTPVPVQAFPVDPTFNPIGRSGAVASPALQTPPKADGVASPAVQSPIQGAINALQAIVSKK